MTDTLALVPAGIDTYRQPVVYMHEDCHICRAEGFAAQTRVRIDLRDQWVIATLNVVARGGWLAVSEAALSTSAWSAIGAQRGDLARFSHPEPAVSTSRIRAKAYGERLAEPDFASIIRDTLDHRLTDLDLAAFITACAGERLHDAETVALTRAMQAAGETLDWGGRTVLDKHCVGGLPGNRTTPLVVAIVAAAGLMIPKTSSRAITSPAGTADTMEVMAPVTLFGFDLAWDRQLLRARNWQRQAPRRRWLLIEERALSECTDRRAAQFVGVNNKRRWWLVPAHALRADCTPAPHPVEVDAPRLDD